MPTPAEQSYSTRHRQRILRPSNHGRATVARVLEELATVRGDRPGHQRIVLVSHQVQAIVGERNH